MFDINNWEFRWSSDCESKIEREHESLPVIDDNETLWNLLVAVRGLNLINRFEVCSPSSHIWVTLTQTKCWNSQQTFFIHLCLYFWRRSRCFIWNIVHERWMSDCVSIRLNCTLALMMMQSWCIVTDCEVGVWVFALWFRIKWHKSPEFHIPLSAEESALQNKVFHCEDFT